MCRDATCGSYDSSFDTSYDEDVQVVELGDVSKWEHASSYPYASRGHLSPTSFSDKIFRQVRLQGPLSEARVTLV